MNQVKINENLRRILLKLRAEDERVREKLAETGELFDGYCPKMEKVHLENAAELERMIAENNNEWLGKSIVGADGADAAWLIVQHAISLPEFSRKCLKLIETAVKKGEAEPRNAAYLQDRIAFFEGRPQKYGTQSDWNADGKMQVWNLENAEKINEYRVSVGLKPLESLIWESEEMNDNAPQDFAKRQKEADEWLEKTGWRK